MKECDYTIRSMLFRRWGKALQSRHAGAGFKPPLGAVDKIHGAEHKRKRLKKISQVDAMKLNVSEELKKRC